MMIIITTIFIIIEIAVIVVVVWVQFSEYKTCETVFL